VFESRLRKNFPPPLCGYCVYPKLRSFVYPLGPLGFRFFGILHRTGNTLLVRGTCSFFELSRRRYLPIAADLFSTPFPPVFFFLGFLPPDTGLLEEMVLDSPLRSLWKTDFVSVSFFSFRCVVCGELLSLVEIPVSRFGGL